MPHTVRQNCAEAEALARTLGALPLGQYGWFAGNSSNSRPPVGNKRPNDWGLFDMYGPVWDWCQDRCKPYPQAVGGEAIDDVEDILSIDNKDRRVLRGGLGITPPRGGTSFTRHNRLPTDNLWYYGFRPARTFTP
jgi:formylglycine-generating enzyme required for sulfatase activity